MVSYRFLVQQISGYFEGCEFLHVPRADNDQQMPWHGSAPPGKQYQPASLYSASSSRLSNLCQSRIPFLCRLLLKQSDPT